MTMDLFQFSQFQVLQVQDISTILDIPPSKVAHLVKLGALKPMLEGVGTGRNRTFKFDQLIKGALAVELEKNGLTSQAAAEYASISNFGDISQIKDLPQLVVFSLKDRKGQPMPQIHNHLSTNPLKPLVDHLKKSRGAVIIHLQELVTMLWKETESYWQKRF